MQSSGGRHVLLQGADRVLVSSESDLADRNASWAQDGSRGNKHWTVELVSCHPFSMPILLGHPMLRTISYAFSLALGSMKRSAWETLKKFAPFS